MRKRRLVGMVWQTWCWSLKDVKWHDDAQTKSNQYKREQFQRAIKLKLKPTSWPLNPQHMPRGSRWIQQGAYQVFTRAQCGPPVAHSENLQESMAFSMIFASIERCLHIFPWTTEKVVSPKSKQLVPRNPSRQWTSPTTSPTTIAELASDLVGLPIASQWFHVVPHSHPKLIP